VNAKTSNRLNALASIFVLICKGQTLWLIVPISKLWRKFRFLNMTLWVKHLFYFDNCRNLLPDIEISLCGGLDGDGPAFSTVLFEQSRVTFDDFVLNLQVSVLFNIISRSSLTLIKNRLKVPRCSTFVESWGGII
jgi:hypothetical protein